MRMLRKTSENKEKEFLLALMGILAPHLCTLDGLLIPPLTQVNFPEHVSAKSPSNISPNPSEVICKFSSLLWMTRSWEKAFKSSESHSRGVAIAQWFVRRGALDILVASL